MVGMAGLAAGTVMAATIDGDGTTEGAIDAVVKFYAETLTTFGTCMHSIVEDGLVPIVGGAVPAFSAIGAACRGASVDRSWCGPAGRANSREDEDVPGRRVKEKQERDMKKWTDMSRLSGELGRETCLDYRQRVDGKVPAEDMPGIYAIDERGISRLAQIRRHARGRDQECEYGSSKDEFTACRSKFAEDEVIEMRAHVDDLQLECETHRRGQNAGRRGAAKGKKGHMVLTDD
jgi:hypothetical protein